MFSRPYSRKLEAEADQVGLQLAAKVSIFLMWYISLIYSYFFVHLQFLLRNC